MKFYLYIISILLLLSGCEELPDLSQNPFEFSEEEQVPEIIFLDDFITGNTATLNWTGNTFALGFSYKLERRNEVDNVFMDVFDWTPWSKDSSTTLEFLDDGNYLFSVRTHFNFEKEDEESVEFTIDEIQGSSLRISPLMQYVYNSSSFGLDLYLEEVNNIMGVEVKIQYDTGQFEFSHASWGGIVNKFHESGQVILNPEPEDDNGELSLSVAFTQDGFSGTGPLINLVFNIPGGISPWNESAINISSAELLDKDGFNISINQLVGGIVRVSP